MLISAIMAIINSKHQHLRVEVERMKISGWGGTVALTLVE